MEMTKEEKKARRSDLRQQTITARYESMRASMIGAWQRAKEGKWSHQQLLDYRAKWIYTDAYKLVPQYIKERLSGVWDTLFYLAYAKDLVFCYPHPETGVITDCVKICNEGLAGLLSEKGLDKQGNHYWKNEDGTFTHAF